MCVHAGFHRHSLWTEHQRLLPKSLQERRTLLWRREWIQMCLPQRYVFVTDADLLLEKLQGCKLHYQEAVNSGPILNFMLCAYTYIHRYAYTHIVLLTLAFTGFTGTNCEVNIDDCYAHPCLNGGTCYDAISGYTCRCRNGFSGRNCEENINDCQNVHCQHGRCIDNINDFECRLVVFTSHFQVVFMI